MSDNYPKTSAIEKNCHDSECTEKIAGLTSEQKDLFKKFTYCPYCSEELILICQNCREQLDSPDYRFCPWCGARFVEDDEEK
ncbi:MAG: zinc-ribbon domain-containing protein [Deltaproteobacteria bacterium]|jgi:predicted RNA-binding Zn-ribbon protein involved in translation (DUF1610 family)|nr:zinc-ribbon domain-containing protein [Deltaproteobacteria bacterium]